MTRFCMYVCMYVYMYVCMYMYAYVYMLLCILYSSEIIIMHSLTQCFFKIFSTTRHKNVSSTSRRKCMILARSDFQQLPFVLRSIQRICRYMQYMLSGRNLTMYVCMYVCITRFLSILSFKIDPYAYITVCT